MGEVDPNAAYYCVQCNTFVRPEKGRDGMLRCAAGHEPITRASYAFMVQRVQEIVEADGLARALMDHNAQRSYYCDRCQRVVEIRPGSDTGHTAQCATCTRTAYPVTAATIRELLRLLTNSEARRQQAEQRVQQVERRRTVHI